VSTKRLSRTVLEAGQWHPRRHFIKEAIRSERSEARIQTAEARRDPELAAQLHVRPRRQEDKDFARDKLSAAERWLRAQVGRPWAKVKAEIRSRFDTRSVPGRHLVFEHLLPRGDELEDGWRVNRRFTFFVDRHGFLRARQ
jgi:hypothetical protein